MKNKIKTSTTVAESTSFLIGELAAIEAQYQALQDALTAARERWYSVHMKVDGTPEFVAYCEETGLDPDYSIEDVIA